MNLRHLRDIALAVAALAVPVMYPSWAAAQSSGGPANASPQTVAPWAYPVGPAVPAAKDDGSLRHVPGSDVGLTLSQTRDAFNVPDWHPGDHPSMPDAVAHGRKPDLRACGYCHLPNGQGRPENASVAGLPAAYIVQQVADFKSGSRVSAEPKMGPPAAMIAVAKNATDADVAAAAEYFSQIKLKPWIRVVETKSVPKTRVAGGMLVPAEGGGMEPMGERIIEMPENLEQTELRDAAKGFVAYVPIGSIKKGAALVAVGGSKTIRCAICHGPGLKGLAAVPNLAGRSPSYIVRQLYDIQSGARKGPWSPLMKEVVAKLTMEDMVSIAAYTASQAP